MSEQRPHTTWAWTGNLCRQPLTERNRNHETRLLAACAAALALCAPVVANAANIIKGVTIQNYNEKFNSSLATMKQMGSQPTTICFEKDSCLTVMDFADPVVNHVIYSLNWATIGNLTFTYMCVGPIGTDSRECINQYGKHTLEKHSDSENVWKTIGTLTD